jgi:peptidoglycan/LPS O-acetylase OafA/YrhL
VVSKHLPNLHFVPSTSAKDAQTITPVHFPFLTELRFIAALGVLIHHVALVRWLAGVGPELHGWILGLGSNGVRVFFVLSGFLITHLLLSELNSTGSVDVRKFYFRRMLRIWPLYYSLLVLVLLIPAPFFLVGSSPELASLVTAKFQDFGIKLSMFLFMLPNMALVMFPPMIGFAQTWSIGVEEQFYVLWPVLMKRFGGKPLFVLSGVVLAKIAVCYSLLYLLGSSLLILSDNVRSTLWRVSSFLGYLEIEAMAIGGVAAYVLISRPTIVRAICHNVFFRTGVILAVLVCLSRPWYQLHEYVLSDFVYGAALLCLTLSDRHLPAWLGQPLGYFGKISYGIYMIHPLVIHITTKALYELGFLTNRNLSAVALYALTIASTLLLAALSYECFEKKILALKSKFTVVASSA